MWKSVKLNTAVLYLICPDNCQRDGHEREKINTEMPSFINILVCSHIHYIMHCTSRLLVILLDIGDSGLELWNP